jgi:hypothetical protein
MGSARGTWVTKRKTTQGVNAAAQAQNSHMRWRSAQAIRPDARPAGPAQLEPTDGAPGGNTRDIHLAPGFRNSVCKN